MIMLKPTLSPMASPELEYGPSQQLGRRAIR